MIKLNNNKRLLLYKYKWYQIHDSKFSNDDLINEPYDYILVLKQEDI